MASSDITKVGLDLGSTKIAAAIVRCQGDETPELLGFSQKRCRFLREGTVVNLELMISSVQECLMELRSLVKHHVSQVTVNLPPCAVRYETGDAHLELGKRREVKRKHLRQLLNASTLLEDEAWELIHSIPEEYTLDEQAGIRSPIGMIGSSLSVRVQQVYAATKSVNSILYGVNKCKLQVTHLVIDPLGAMASIITPDEKELGVWIVDLGGAYTSYAAIKKDRIALIGSIPLGGDAVTSDIAIGVRTPIRDAEDIKVKHGRAISEFADEELQLEITPLGGGRTRRKISQQLLTEIIQPRMDEILDLIAREFHQNLDKNEYHSGVILTGAGSMIRGVKELAEKHLQLPVITGNLRDVSNLSDIASTAMTSTAVGLALYGHRHPQVKHWDQTPVNPLTRFFKRLTG
jgi:cell division protein FtsA